MVWLARYRGDPRGSRNPLPLRFGLLALAKQAGLIAAVAGFGLLALAGIVLTVACMVKFLFFT